jgi:hypothetical protein
MIEVVQCRFVNTENTARPESVVMHDMPGILINNGCTTATLRQKNKENNPRF